MSIVMELPSVKWGQNAFAKTSDPYHPTQSCKPKLIAIFKFS